MSLSTACVTSTFSLDLFGATVQTIHANLVTNFSMEVPAVFRISQPAVNITNASFCNVTVTYTHPGQNDSINVETWLPISSEWNGKLQAIGGGGYAAGRTFITYAGMAGAVYDGYATTTTDAGVEPGDTGAGDPAAWALLSPGNVNLYKLRNAGYLSLNEQAIIAKAVIENFYTTGPSYSYWIGCSNGGRQGYELAQHYPDAYDGILAAAPAIDWSGIQTAIFWPQQFMNDLGEYPHGCEIGAITAAAVEKCDGLDGVVDGIISDTDACLADFDPFSVVGSTVNNCSQTGGQVEVSRAAASVANATWHGYTSADGRHLLPGFNTGSDLTGGAENNGVAATNCTSIGCVGNPSLFTTLWWQLFVAKDPDFDYSNLTHAQFDHLVRTSAQEYNSFLGSNDPDLTAFKNSGGKLLTYHGLIDNIIPAKQTENYYNDVSTVLPDVHDFYRLFEVPGLAHCYGGSSSQPESMFGQLRAWVEDGTAPETSPVKITTPNGEEQDRILCPYPRKAKFDTACKDTGKLECWACTEKS